MQKPFKISLFERFENIELTSGQQRPNHLERRILGGSTYQRNNTLLYRTQKRILLTLGETVNFINKQYRRSRIKESTTLCSFYHLADILYATGHRGEGEERHLDGLCHDLSKGSLAHSRGSPEDKRGYAPCINHLAQHGPLTYQMLLSNIVSKRVRSHSFS